MLFFWQVVSDLLAGLSEVVIALFELIKVDTRVYVYKRVASIKAYQLAAVLTDHWLYAASARCSYLNGLATG